MVGDHLLAVIADVVFVCVLVVGDHLLAVIADMVFVCVLVIGDDLLTNIADMVFFRVVMEADISALAAHTVRPLMGFARHGHSAAAAPLLLMNISGPCCPLLCAALVIFGVLFAVGLMTGRADRLGGTGSRTSGVFTVSILQGIIILYIAIGIEALMPVMRRVVLPLLRPAVTVCLNRLNFCRAAFVTGKYFFTCCHAGGLYGHLAAVPIVRVLIILCLTAGAFLPMDVYIMLPQGCGEIVTESRNFAAAGSADDRCRAGRLRPRVSAVVANRPPCRDRQNLRGHLCREFTVPAGEDIARSCQGRRGDRCAVILVDEDILLTVFGLDSDHIRKDLPSGVQRHIPGNRVVKVPFLLRLAGGIRIPAQEVVAFPYRPFIETGFADTLVLLLLARCRTGQYAAVRIERDRAKGRLLPHGVQGAVPRFVIPGRAVTVFVAVLPAAPLLVIPATEKISLVPGYRHLIEWLTIGDPHGSLRHRAAVAVEGHRVGARCPLGCQRDTRYGIVIRKVGIGGFRQYAPVAECPARKIIAGFCRIGNAV